jgi:hypothetical protein
MRKITVILHPKRYYQSILFFFWWVRNYFAFFIQKAFVLVWNRGANLLIPSASFRAPSRGLPSKKQQTT